jgi:phospholipid/cholesterol/gamma-HCH transport system substrate-binding protein
MNHTSRRATIQVGITGLIALVLLLAGILWVKQYQLGKKVVHLVADFDEVGNLSEGDPVAVRGVKKGVVTRILLQDQIVRVEFSVDRGVILHPDVRLRVANIGFMGEKFLALDPGAAPGRYDASKPIPGRFQSGVPEVIAGAGELLTEATELSSRLNEMLDAMDPATMEKTSKNIEKMTRTIAHAVEQNEADLRQAVLDFKAASKQMRAIAEANAEPVATSIKDFGTASQRLTELSGKLSTTADALQRVVERMDKGEGTLGKALADPQLYDDLRETLRNTNDLVKDMKQHPGRYIRLRLF